MADETHIKMIGEGTLADIIAREIKNYRPQSIDLGLSAGVFKDRNTYFRNYVIHLQAGGNDRNLSGRLHTTKSRSVGEIFENLRPMLPQTYDMTDSVPNGSGENTTEYCYLVLKEYAVANDESYIQ